MSCTFKETRTFDSYADIDFFNSGTLERCLESCFQNPNCSTVIHAKSGSCFLYGKSGDGKEVFGLDRGFDLYRNMTEPSCKKTVRYRP
ncbi:PAN domain protein [Oesophagostomum dentatum]|uniref:PAN domain protein n=1 Tax=Oesophagostomum dentatum TaxID=61180 RepID=A0A0B1SPE9_OESDE|nr:PAN domain protein [Oesophagostomum dentatum]